MRFQSDPNLKPTEIQPPTTEQRKAHSSSACSQASQPRAAEASPAETRRIAKEINKSERYVWKALELLENPTKLLESED